ncbi:ROK family protein [Candidatus Microgenomates bacterium]|nr:ROK family protein [Candidatus Microgenomates bacterium]
MYLVFDIGGTNMRIATSLDGKTLSATKIVPTPKDFEQGVQTFKQVADELTNGQKIKAVAAGVTGALDKEKTTQLTSPHVGGWIGKPLKGELERLFNCPIFLENDANLAALGEATYGAGAGHHIVAFLTISTGVGGARIVNQKIDENSLGFEPGHQIIVIDGSPCNCGGKGHLESYVSGSGIERVYGKKAEHINDPQIWDKIARYLAVGLQNTTVFWSPDVIVLGGSVMKSLPLENTKAYLDELLTIFPKPPDVVVGKIGDSAGLYGALALLNLS